MAGFAGLGRAGEVAGSAARLTGSRIALQIGARVAGRALGRIVLLRAAVAARVTAQALVEQAVRRVAVRADRQTLTEVEVVAGVAGRAGRARDGAGLTVRRALVATHVDAILEVAGRAASTAAEARRVKVVRAAKRTAQALRLRA